jgi:nucleoside-diphosphate-sugar epimerase
VFFPYGPGEPPDKLVSYIATQLLQGRPAETTTGGQFRDYIHVADIASAFVALVESSKTGVFNVGTGIPVSVAQIAQAIGRLLEAPDLIRLGGRESGQEETPLLIADVRRVRSELDWQPTVSLEDGLGKTIEALRAVER